MKPIKEKIKPICDYNNKIPQPYAQILKKNSLRKKVLKRGSFFFITQLIYTKKKKPFSIFQ